MTRIFGFVCLCVDILSWDFSCLCGSEVTLKTAVQEVPGSIPGSRKDFCFFVLLLLFLHVVKRIIYMHLLFSFYNDNFFSVLNIRHNFVSDYKVIKIHTKHL